MKNKIRLVRTAVKRSETILRRRLTESIKNILKTLKKLTEKANNQKATAIH